MCKDNSLTYLNGVGYNVIRLPREGIDPLQLLSHGGNALEILGPLSDLVLSGPPAPLVTSDTPAANVNGKRTDKLELGLGLNFLDKILSAMGAPGASLKMAYSKAKSIEFEFENVSVDSVNITAIGQYLKGAKPDIANPIIEMLDEEGEAYVITETIKSNSFGAIAYDSTNSTIDVDVAGIQQAIGVNTKVAVLKDATRKVSYKGAKLLRFGFKAIPVWVLIESGSSYFRLGPPRDIAQPLTTPAPAAILNPEDATPVLFGRNTLIRLNQKGRIGSMNHP